MSIFFPFLCPFPCLSFLPRLSVLLVVFLPSFPPSFLPSFFLSVSCSFGFMPAALVLANPFHSSSGSTLILHLLAITRVRHRMVSSFDVHHRSCSCLCPVSSQPSSQVSVSSNCHLPPLLLPFLLIPSLLPFPSVILLAHDFRCNTTHFALDIDEVMHLYHSCPCCSCSGQVSGGCHYHCSNQNCKNDPCFRPCTGLVPKISRIASHFHLVYTAGPSLCHPFPGSPAIFRRLHAASKQITSNNQLLTEFIQW